MLVAARTADGPQIPDRTWGAPVASAMRPYVATVSEDSTLHQVRRVLTAGEIDALLVTGRVNGTPLGWITAASLLAHLDLDPFHTHAAELLTEPPHVIHPTAPLRHAAAMLAAPGVTHLLVATGERSFAGVLTARDLLRAAT